jgi:hypothetical protein
LHPYSNLTCISSWYMYICIPNIIWIHLTSLRKWMETVTIMSVTDRRTENRTGIAIPYYVPFLMGV